MCDEITLDSNQFIRLVFSIPPFALVAEQINAQRHKSKSLLRWRKTSYAYTGMINLHLNHLCMSQAPL